jgi:predicted PurR-regulated permease PerM
MSLIPADRLKQVFLIGAIGYLAYILSKELFQFFPGFLGAIMLYVLLRGYYYKLTVVKGWKKWVTAVLFIIGSLVVIVLPIFLLIQMLAPKAQYAVEHANDLTAGVTAMTQKVQTIIPGFKADGSQLRSVIQRASSSVPGVLGSAANIFTNVMLAFFLLYFMLVDGRIMERNIQRFLGLKEHNIDLLWAETRTMVVANAIGLPVLAIFQAIFAAIGYAIFGVDQWLLWAVVTGAFSLVPIVGTAIIWIPLTVFLYATGKSGQGTGLLLYSVLVITNVDNVLRFTILRKLGDVHPIITVLGIIVGIPLFGFMGFIFGPLLLSYMLLLVKVYRIEVSQAPAEEPARPLGT